MDKVRILGIAPYEGIRKTMLELAKFHKDVELKVVIGNLEQATSIVTHYDMNKFDVIISRGGTAELIRKNSLLPVIDIPLSVYDIFRSIKLASNYSNKYALVGFPTITRNAHFLCDMLYYNIDIYTINNEEEAAATLTELVSCGCDMVLCDMITNSLAQQYGLASILITSGPESIENAFEEAINIAHLTKALSSERIFLEAIIKEQPFCTFVFNNHSELILQTPASSESEFAIPLELEDIMRNSIADFKVNQHKNITFEATNTLYTIIGTKKQINQEVYSLFYIQTKTIPLSLYKNGIRYISSEESYQQYINSFHGITRTKLTPQTLLNSYVQSSRPIVVIGEPGTGKQDVIHYLHHKSSFHNKPMAIIDCTHICQKSWNYLMHNVSSPLGDSNTMVFIKHIDSLPDSHYQELLDIIMNESSHSPNRFLFTFHRSSDEELSSKCRMVCNTLSCLVLELPPLRNHVENIPNLSSLYISRLNVEFTKEIIGIEPKGIDLLKKYSWPDNYKQFIRIMSELMVQTDSPYISAASVFHLLNKEQPLSSTTQNIDLTKTLDEITQEIILQVLAEERGNQSAAAKRLGIGRTTLWRMLQKAELTLTQPNEKEI